MEEQNPEDFHCERYLCSVGITEKQAASAQRRDCNGLRGWFIFENLEGHRGRSVQERCQEQEKKELPH